LRVTFWKDFGQSQGSASGWLVELLFALLMLLFVAAVQKEKDG
jgi:hypothetical protein